MFSLFKKKPFFSPEDNEIVVESIRVAERHTTGEIRVFVESRCRFVDPLDRAREIFLNLKMNETEHRNGVLFYVALKDRQLAVFADKGIHEAVGEQYWQEVVRHIIVFFDKDNHALGIKECVLKIGEALQSYFPYDATTDKNELPDEIIFGK
jgi:uncharacterized membrane protein